MKITQEAVKNRFNYNTDTGVFTYRNVSRYSKRKAGEVAGWVNSQGYWALQINRTTYLAHRVAWLYITGVWPKKTIDHIDGNKTNNAFSNLRDVSHQDNCINSPAKRRKDYGIYWDKARNQWKVQTWKNGSAVFHGRFFTKETARKVLMQTLEKENNQQ